MAWSLQEKCQDGTIGMGLEWRAGTVETDTLDEFFARRLEIVKAGLKRRTVSEVLARARRRASDLSDMTMVANTGLGYMGPKVVIYENAHVPRLAGRHDGRRR